MYPERCKACEKKGIFKIVPKESTFKKVQTITLQELPEAVPTGLLPRRFKVELEERLAESVKPGTRVKIVGVLNARQRKKKDPNKSLVLYMTTNSVDDEEKDTALMSIDQEDIEKFMKMATMPNHLERVANSIAPSIYGYQPIKKALALQQCEGVSKTIHGRRRRGQIHVLMAGDPGVGKSVILGFISDLNPRGISISGRGSTVAGLTATVTKEEGTGEWILMAGAMVLADGGIVCADEVEKMRKEDREAMHPAMSIQKLAINKAGINVVLNTRCSVLAAGNPKGGRWNSYKIFTENINLPPTLITRFDLIFVLKSDRTVEDEMEVARYVSKIHRDPSSVKAPIPYETLRKFFAYARTLKPNIGDGALGKLEEFYEKMYKAGLDANSLMITMRQMEGLIRLTEASAKLHLREVATVDDAFNAIQAVHYSLVNTGIDPETGEIDLDIYHSGIPKSLRSKLIRIVEVVGNLSKENLSGEWVDEDLLLDWLGENWKVKQAEAKRILEIAEQEGQIFSPKPKRWKKT